MMETTMQAPAVNRAALRYPGGKWKLAPWLLNFFPYHDVYVEPFCGGASVFFQKQRVRGEVLNDIDGEVANFFRVLRDPEQAEKLIREIELTPFSREEFEAAFEPAGDPVENARRLAVRAYLGQGCCINYYQNGFRSKRLTDKFPARDWMLYPDALKTVVERLRGVVIENVTAAEAIERYDGPTTLFYCDPPYVQSTRSGNESKLQYRCEMSDQDHKDLAATLHGIQGMAVISGYPSALYDELYGDWNCYRRKHHKDRAVESTECVWLSPRCGGLQTRLRWD